MAAVVTTEATCNTQSRVTATMHAAVTGLSGHEVCGGSSRLTDFTGQTHCQSLCLRKEVTLALKGGNSHSVYGKGVALALERR